MAQRARPFETVGHVGLTKLLQGAKQCESWTIGSLSSEFDSSSWNYCTLLIHLFTWGLEEHVDICYDMLILNLKQEPWNPMRELILEGRFQCIMPGSSELTDVDLGKFT